MNVRSSALPKGGIYKISEDYPRVENHKPTKIQEGIRFKGPLETQTGQKSKTKPVKGGLETVLGFELTRNKKLPIRSGD